MKLLVVEDEEVLRNGVVEYFTQEGCVCEQASLLQMGLEKVALYKYDIVVVDLGLPDGDGMDLIKALKNQDPDVGILIISARDGLEDKITGLNIGADDYITKPFHLSELNARIQALIRRKVFQGASRISIGELVVDLNSNKILVDGREVELSKKEYDLLRYFISNKNRVVTKAAISEHLWGDYMDLADNFDLVYSHVKNLRKKLNQFASENYIKTVYGMGYKFVDP